MVQLEESRVLQKGFVACWMKFSILSLKLQKLFFHIFDIIFTIFAAQKKRMKRYKVIEVIRMLLADGWEYCYTKGDHRQFKHPNKPGKVTVRGKDSETLDQFNLNSIWKQAGWK